MPMTLRELRERAGLTLEEAVARISTLESSAPTTRTGLWHLENKGTDRLRVIRAMAAVYDVSREVVEEVAVQMLHHE